MSAKSRTAVLHIGPHKTGTTAVQRMLAEARQTLLAQGWAMPDGHENHSFLLSLLFWDADSLPRIGRLFWRDTADRLDAFRAARMSEFEQIAATAQNLVLSAEEVSRFRPDESRRLIAFLQQHFDDVRVIAYARDPEDWLDSAAQQHVKLTGLSLDTVFARPDLPDHARIIGMFDDLIGRENVDLRPYRQGEGFDIRADFVDAAGLPEDILSVGKERQNTSISMRSAVAIAFANEVFPAFVNHARNPLRAQGVLAPGPMEGPAFRLPRETMETFSAQLDDRRASLSDRLRQKLEPRVGSRPGRADWDALMTEEFRERAVEHARLRAAAQNEKAVRAYVLALEQEDRADWCIGQGIGLATDLWTLTRLAERAAGREHPDRFDAFARLRVMRAIEAGEVFSRLSPFAREREADAKT